MPVHKTIVAEKSVYEIMPTCLCSKCRIVTFGHKIFPENDISIMVQLGIPTCLSNF